MKCARSSTRFLGWMCTIQTLYVQNIILADWDLAYLYVDDPSVDAIPVEDISVDDIPLPLSRTGSTRNVMRSRSEGRARVYGGRSSRSRLEQAKKRRATSKSSIRCATTAFFLVRELWSCGSQYARITGTRRYIGSFSLFVPVQN